MKPMSGFPKHRPVEDASVLKDTLRQAQCDNKKSLHQYEAGFSLFIFKNYLA